MESLLAWGHFLSGITWIGILYYFNFIQVPFLKVVTTNLSVICQRSLTKVISVEDRGAIAIEDITGRNMKNYPNTNILIFIQNKIEHATAIFSHITPFNLQQHRS